MDAELVKTLAFLFHRLAVQKTLDCNTYPVQIYNQTVQVKRNYDVD
jgi:hypothetical protein